jgi:integrase
MDSRENDGFPKLIKRGSFTVKIYRVSNKGRISFTVAYSSNGKRIMKMFADLNEALTEAKSVADTLDKGEFEVLELHSKDRLRYVHAMQALQPTGISLEMAAQEYADAMKMLAGKATILEAVRDYVRRATAALPSKTLPEAVEEMWLAKEKEGASDAYMKVLRFYLGKVKTAFTGQLCDFTTPVLSDYLRKMRGAARSRNNARQTIGAFFKFCRERGWLPRDHEGIELISKFKEAPKGITVFTPWEMSKYLMYAREELVPFLAIGGFAGLRSAEIQRLDWQQIHLSDRFIEVTAKIAKTASRRVVPISDNLAQWLTPYVKQAGRVVPFENMSKQIEWLVGAANKGLREEAKAAGNNPDEAASLDWKKNALRHSYISYRVAEIQNVNQVALECGNSPAMIFKHYRELVRPAEAKKWFSIQPDVAMPCRLVA